MNYYISDTHFGHENIIKHDANNGCRQFSSIEEHDNLIIENWNRVVTPQDNIYILGDFSWLYARETEELISAFLKISSSSPNITIALDDVKVFLKCPMLYIMLIICITSAIVIFLPLNVIVSCKKSF